MAITRNRLQFEERFTQVPNSWLRDERLSWRARGIVAGLLSHRVGWKTSVEAIARGGLEGRDATRTAVNELIEHGYLVRKDMLRTGEGKFDGIEYELCDPFDNPPSTGFPSTGYPSTGYPSTGNPTPKKTINKEDQVKEHQVKESSIAGATDEVFKRFYAVYPRKVGKQAALKAWAKAVKLADPEVIIESASRFASDPNLPTEKQFIPHPSSWLNAGRWDDEPLPPRQGQVVVDAEALAIQRMEAMENGSFGGGPVGEIRSHGDAAPLEGF